ncbi:transmembrane protein 101-like [Montipora capricornis]|uniref:transmembrane protein 101-like n=1 Tax=Montipora capricornis TaxID=246305 RepID=UPI0035F19F16
MGTLDRTFRILDALGLFIVTRFPFIELFLLLMATGDQAEKTPLGKITNFRDTFRREFILVYFNAFVFFVCGTGMTLDFKRRQCGFAAAVHAIVYTVITLYQQKGHSEYLIVRISVRTVAVCAGYLFVTGGLTDSERGRTKVTQALQLGRQILAFYLFCNAYMIWASEQDRLAHIKNIPGGVAMIYIVIAIYAIPGICIYGGYEAGYFGRIVSWLLVIITVLVDFNAKYWYRSSAHVEFWCQIQHASRNVCVIGSLLLLARIRHW